MRILVLYSTVEGHTGKIAETISNWLETAGYETALTRPDQVGYLDPANFDAVFLCAPIHIGRYPVPFVEFIKNWRGSLQSVPTALITVSLAIASDNEKEVQEAIAFPRKLENVTGWNAAVEYNAAGALKYLEYDYFRKWMMRRIAKKEGGPTDTSKGHDLTDWDALKSFVDRFVNEVDA